MRDDTAILDHQPPARPAPWLRLLRPYLRRVEHGSLRILADGREQLLVPGRKPGTAADIHVHRPYALAARLLTRGTLGLAEGYMAGDWDTPDLRGFLRWAAANQDATPRGGRAAALFRLADRLRHVLGRRNSRRGSRRNIASHYDLGNDFYRLWLDPGMTYSSALFAHRGEALEAAQQRKYRRMLELLDAAPGASVLEIGCGWGGFAEEAARRGHPVTGLTLSREQLAHARRRLDEAGLGGRADLRLQDYRDVSGRFDHIVSIEMLEAVGEDYWPGFFATLHGRLAPGGSAALQFITIAPERFAAYRRGVDFIQRYVFPGGMLPTSEVVRDLAARHGLAVEAQEAHGAHYAETLERWYEAFLGCEDRLPGRLGEERFRRLWRFYLAYCIAGFRAGTIDLVHMRLRREA